MIRHLHSLRRMKRDHGWIHTLLEEAENERMHLLTFMPQAAGAVLPPVGAGGAGRIFQRCVCCKARGEKEAMI